MFCHQCGAALAAVDRFCTHCGCSQYERDDVVADGGEELFYKVMIGPKNQDYYLKHFAHFDDEGHAGITWNWPAFLFTQFWFLYRKMWGYAALYFVVPYIAAIPLGVVSALGNEKATIVAYAVWVLILVFGPPLYANALYYRHCRKKIESARNSSGDVQRQLGELAARGGTSRAVWLVLLLIVPFIVGILAAIALPAYQDHSVRVKLTGDVAFGMRAAQSIGNYYSRYEQFPENLSQAGFRETLPGSISSVRIETSGLVHLGIVGSGDKPIGTLLLVPSWGADDRISWRCASEDIDDKLLPKQCRKR